MSLLAKYPHDCVWAEGESKKDFVLWSVQALVQERQQYFQYSLVLPQRSSTQRIAWNKKLGKCAWNIPLSSLLWILDCNSLLCLDIHMALYSLPSLLYVIECWAHLDNPR